MSDFLPPLPILPDFNIDESSSDTITLRNSQSSSQPIYDKTRTQNIINYVTELHKSIVPRMEKYEKTQKELIQIIEREKIIEIATQRLLTINFIFCLLLPFSIIVSFFIFCLYHVPNEVKAFFDEYKIIASVFGLAVILFIAKPLYDIHGYNKRLDAIEKTLHLNGN